MDSAFKLKSDFFRFFDDDVFHRYVSMHACTAGFDVLDLVDDFLAFGYGAENAVAPAILSRIVEEIIVADVNEELGRRAQKTGNLKPERRKIEKY